MALDAEGTERPSIEIEGQKRAICTGRDFAVRIGPVATGVRQGFQFFTMEWSKIDGPSFQTLTTKSRGVAGKIFQTTNGAPRWLTTPWCPRLPQQTKRRLGHPYRFGPNRGRQS